MFVTMIMAWNLHQSWRRHQLCSFIPANHIHPWLKRLNWNRKQNTSLWFLFFGHWWILSEKILKPFSELCKYPFPWRKYFILSAKGSIPMTIHQSSIIHKHSGPHLIFQTRFSMCFGLEAKTVRYSSLNVLLRNRWDYFPRLIC